MSRTKSSIKNFIWAIIGQGAGLIISFVARIVFVRTLGNEYLGLSGLFTNILTMLSLAELGIGNAIIYSLYKPLAEKDTKKSNMLMQFYQKVYTIVGIIILIVGTLIIPLLPFFIKEMPNIQNINLIYFLFLLNTSMSYFFSYKRNLIIADQNRYIATIYRYSFYFLLNVAQIIYLLITHNYIGYLILQIISTLLENIFISLKADKMYPYLKSKEKIKLDFETKNEILKNTKALMMHKIGGIIVNSTDNIILSKFVGIIEVGLYSNYYLIINALNTIFGQVFNSLTASVGNLFVDSEKEKQYSVFKNINFLTFWIYSFSSICLLNLFNPFISIWLGKNYLFSIDIVLILVINFYVTGMRKSVLTFKDADGLFYKDRYKPLIESLINLVVSIVLAKKLETLGVFIGTFASTVTTSLWVEPYVLYKYGFNKKLSKYFKDYLKYLGITIILALITYFVCSFINTNVYLAFVLKLLVSFLIPNVVIYLIFRKSDEYKFFDEKIFKKIKNKLKKKSKF